MARQIVAKKTEEEKQKGKQSSGKIQRETTTRRARVGTRTEANKKSNHGAVVSHVQELQQGQNLPIDQELFENSVKVPPPAQLTLPLVIQLNNN
ncbi:hypothetical protein DAMA08_018890 [Martiniozyma asiatica (nom. inval.)]|nr:hypothetical protein DAMA08_018890 [Martiniozyma asiatica]